MYYLGIDTSNKFIIVTIFNDEDVLYFKQEVGNRKASELISVLIKEAIDELNITMKDLSGIVVTKGPGSFTGVRIGLSSAKVLAMTLNINLYTLSSLNYYAGLSKKNIILDARSKKVFLGEYLNGVKKSEVLIPITDLRNNKTYYGDLSVFSEDDNYGDLSRNFLELKEYWEEESYFDAVPLYLKSNL